MGFMHGLDCLPVLGPSWEELHFGLEDRRRRSPKLSAWPSVIQHCCPVAIPASHLSSIMADRTEQSGIHIPSAAPPNFSAFVFFLFPLLSIFSLSRSLSLLLHSISCSLSGPYSAYVTITKSTRIAAAID